MSSEFDLSDLTPLINQIMFGTTDDDADAEGGIMAALELEETQVVDDDDPGDRPEGLFVTFKTFDGSEALYGQAIEDYATVEADPDEDPDDPGGCLLVYDNARIVQLRIAIHAPAETYTSHAVRNLARLAQRHLNSVTNNELALLGLDAYIVSPGRVRNATTVLNESVERVFAFDARLLVGERYTVPVETFEKVTLTLQERPAGEEEEEEIDL